MSDQAARVAVDCPVCGAETVHEVLKPGGHATVRCTDCGHTHKERIERPETVDLDVIVSHGDESVPGSATRPRDEAVAVGDEFVVDADGGLHQVRVTSVELGEERRVESAEVDAVETVWTRAVDNVGVDVTIHPAEGDGHGRESRSVTAYVPGDYEFVVGAEESFGDEEFEVEGIKLRGEADGYRAEKLDRTGDAALAKDATRVYGRDTTSTAWSAW